MDKSLILPLFPPSSFRFPKGIRLRTRRDFKRLNQVSTRQAGTWILLDYYPNQKGHLRLGITVTRRFGKANKRNEFKRRIREAFRLCQEKYLLGFDINIRPRTLASKASFEDIQKDLRQLLSRL